MVRLQKMLNCPLISSLQVKSEKRERAAGGYALSKGPSVLPVFAFLLLSLL